MKNFFFTVIVILFTISMNVSAQIVSTTSINDIVTVIDKYNTSELTPYCYTEVRKYNDGIYSLGFYPENRFEENLVVVQLGNKDQAPETIKMLIEIFKNCSSKKKGSTTFTDADGHVLTAYKVMGGYYLDQEGIAKSHTGRTTKAISLGMLDKILNKFIMNKY